MTEDQRPGGLNRDQLLTGLVSSEASLLGLEMAVFSLYLLTVSPLCVCVLIASLRTATFLEQGPPSWPHFNLSISLKTLLPNSPIQRHWGLRLEHVDWGRGSQFIPQH